MKKTTTVAGQDLRDMFSAATSWLEKNSADIDALNVFPVPDGDTGTNMLLTMRSTMEEAFRAPDHSAAGVAQAMAKGSLMAGQSVGLVDRIMPLKDIIDEFARDAEAELQRLKTALGPQPDYKS